MQTVFDQVRLESPLVTSKRLYARTNFSVVFSAIGQELTFRSSFGRVVPDSKHDYN
jgi:hypothetical protein